MERKEKEMIDIVLPYVNNNDRVWQKTYINYCVDRGYINKITAMRGNRFDDNNMFEYLFKGIEKFMPFVNRVFLLVSNIEQVPAFIKRHKKVKVVLHREFIYSQYLPTFNSTTIEMFLWNIKELGEYFIYANDDMLPFKELKEEDFFTEDGKIKIEWWEEDIRQVRTVFRIQCINSHHHLLNRFGIKHDSWHYIRPAHSMTPMIKSHCVQAYLAIKPLIEKHIRAFRTEYQYNQYIYPIYEKIKYGTCDSNIDFLYTQFKDGIDLDHQIVCLNVVPRKLEKDIIAEIEKRL